MPREQCQRAANAAIATSPLRPRRPHRRFAAAVRTAAHAASRGSSGGSSARSTAARRAAAAAVPIDERRPVDVHAEQRRADGAAPPRAQSPYIMSAVHPTASAAPASAPIAVTSAPSRRKMRRTAPRENPVARSTPICVSRCSMLNRKNRAVSSSADTIRKKLKYEKYAPKSVAPAEADRFCERTLTTRHAGAQPDRRPRDRAPRRRGERRLQSRPARRLAYESGARSRSDVSWPYRRLPEPLPDRRAARTPWAPSGTVASRPRLTGRTSLRSIGNGGSQSAKLSELVMPG